MDGMKYHYYLILFPNLVFRTMFMFMFIRFFCGRGSTRCHYDSNRLWKTL